MSKRWINRAWPGLVLATAFALDAATPPGPGDPVPIESLQPRPPLSAATREKLARMTPIFDGVSLDGWIQAPPAPIRVAREDIIDIPAFAREVGEPVEGAARFLHARLDEAGRAAAATISATTPAPREAVSAFFRSLNLVVAADSPVFDEAQLRGIALRPETEAMHRARPRGVELARLNRLLLEDAFPRHVKKSPDTGWIVRDGSMASTGAGRGVIFSSRDYTRFRLVFDVRQISGNHVPGVLIFGERPAGGEAGRDALGAIQFQVPNGGHWDYRPGMNKAGDHFTRPVRIRYDVHEWAQVEMLVDATNGTARMAVAQPVGTRAIENLLFTDPAAGRTGPIAWQMHNAGLFDEFRNVRIELNPTEDRLLTVE